MSDIIYQEEPDLGPEEFVELLRQSRLAERRPVDEQDTIAGMLRHADVILTARCGRQLVGVARDHGL